MDFDTHGMFQGVPLEEAEETLRWAQEIEKEYHSYLRGRGLQPIEKKPPSDPLLRAELAAELAQINQPRTQPKREEVNLRKFIEEEMDFVERNHEYYKRMAAIVAEFDEKTDFVEQNNKYNEYINKE